MSYCKVCGKKLELTPEYDMCIECQGKMHRTYTLPNNDGVVSNKSSMNRYDRYEDGIVIDKMSGENNLLELVRVGDCVEMDNEWEILKVLRFSRYNNMVCMVRTSSNTEEYEFQKYRREYIKAIWFRSGDTMKRMEVEHERV